MLMSISGRAVSIVQVDALLRECDEATKNHVLDGIAARYPADVSLLNHLIVVAESADPSLELATTALLKRYHVAGAHLPASAAGRLIDLLSAVARWESRLQILQMLPTLEIPASHADSLCDCLQRLIRDRNGFIRAWAYSGLHRLASVYPEYRSDVVALLRNAARKDVASVRARLRQLPSLQRHDFS
jgi:hypothetical protein